MINLCLVIIIIYNAYFSMETCMQLEKRLSKSRNRSENDERPNKAEQLQTNKQNANAKILATHTNAE